METVGESGITHNLWWYRKLAGQTKQKAVVGVAILNPCITIPDLHRKTVNPLKCSGVRCLHFEVFSAFQA